ncbi:hypothetical protein KEM55_007030, partial [Ascosphaera atra]
RDDANDDHKFVNERLLEIPIPPDRADGGVITLEDCLESYFNNHVEVKRYLQRQNSELSKAKLETKLDTKIAVTHVESVDASTSNASSPSASPRMTPLPGSPAAPHPPVREGTPSSIIQKRWVPEDNEEEHRKNHEQPPAGPAPGPKTRKGSLRHEVMMPALQVFGLIPWYADNLSSDDAQTAIHFSQKRPILGMCLKRRSYGRKRANIRELQASAAGSRLPQGDLHRLRTLRLSGSRKESARLRRFSNKLTPSFVGRLWKGHITLAAV